MNEVLRQILNSEVGAGLKAATFPAPDRYGTMQDYPQFAAFCAALTNASLLVKEDTTRYVVAQVLTKAWVALSKDRKAKSQLQGERRSRKWRR